MARSRRDVGAAPLFAVLCILCTATGIGGVHALPTAADGDGKAETHEHWEHIVRRAADTAWDDRGLYEDDTAHIVNVQEYYRTVFRELLPVQEKVGQASSLHHITTTPHGSSFNLPTTKPVKGRYIVMFSSGIVDDYVLDKTIEILEVANYKTDQRLRATDITPFRNIRRGFTATLNSKTLELMHKHPFVEYIEEDIALRRTDSYGYQPVYKQEEEEEEEEEEARSSYFTVGWNLDRIDQRMNKLNGEYNPEGSGESVDIYICDTGIHYTHKDFEGRAFYGGYDAIDILTGTSDKGADCHSHGTHCAGTAAGRTYGVAKKATLYSLRALDCTGSGAVSGIVHAMDFVARKKQTSNTGRPIIISMSLGVEESKSLNTAIEEMAKQGIVVVSAAGNQGGDSCEYSPASARVGISVGAVDKKDRVVYFSNTGACTDIFAPGESIRSASNACDTCTKSLSGTSMACPHVTGYAAIVLGLRPQLTPQELKEQIVMQSTKDTVALNSISPVLALRTPNRLLYVPQEGADDMDFSAEDDGYLQARVSSMSYRPR